MGFPEKLGGSGGAAADAAEVVDAVSRLGWPSPVADVIWITNHLLGMTSLGLPTGDSCAVTVQIKGVVDGDGRVSFGPARVPWSPWASHLVVPCDVAGGGSALAVIDCRDVIAVPGRDLAGAPAGTVAADGAQSVDVVSTDRTTDWLVEEIRTAGAMARSMQMAAALERVRDLAVSYVSDREQFGRALIEFQAVQQRLAGLAAEVAAARAAVDRALSGIAGLDSPMNRADVAVAKIRTGLAVDRAMPAAHQVHGAMGITREYELSRHSLCVWTWRDDFGTTEDWASWLASDLSDSSRDVWSWLVDA